MVRITFIAADGRGQDVDAESGRTLMQAAVANGVRGILAECGGARVCGTCHCYIGEPWSAVAGALGDDEAMLLDFSEHR